jgi:hypothetical protein
MDRSNRDTPKRLTREEAREALAVEQRPTFDKLCDETIAWSQYFYGTNPHCFATARRPKINPERSPASSRSTIFV